LREWFSRAAFIVLADRIFELDEADAKPLLAAALNGNV
jgi:hypothetical protein